MQLFYWNPKMKHDVEQVMKRTDAFIKTTLLPIVFLFVCCSFSSAYGAEYVSIKKDGVNIRSGASTKDEILWEVFKDFPLKVLETKGKWTHTVDFEGDKGWVFSSLLSSKKTVIVKVKSANMRFGPGTNYEVLATVKYGVVFRLNTVDGEWVKISHDDGTNGWIHKDLLWPDDL